MLFPILASPPRKRPGQNQGRGSTNPPRHGSTPVQQASALSWQRSISLGLGEATCKERVRDASLEQVRLELKSLSLENRQMDLSDEASHLRHQEWYLANGR